MRGRERERREASSMKERKNISLLLINGGLWLIQGRRILGLIFIVGDCIYFELDNIISMLISLIGNEV